MAAEKHKMPGEVTFEDMLLCDFFPAENFRRVQAMDTEDDDVIIASYPKAGTTLMLEMVWLIRRKGDRKEANQASTWERSPFVELADKDRIELFYDNPRPRQMKTHVPYRYLPQGAREKRTKVVYILRNPKDILVSYYHFYRMNKGFGPFKGSWNDYFTMFREADGKLLYGNLFDHIKAYWEHRDDPNVYIAVYEEIVKQPRKCILDLAKFLDVDLTNAETDRIVEATKFDTMRDNPMTNLSHMAAGDDAVYDFSVSPFMRKGKVGDWKNYFTEEQSQIIDAMYEEKVSGIGLEFIYE